MPPSSLLPMPIWILLKPTNTLLVLPSQRLNFPPANLPGCAFPPRTDLSHSRSIPILSSPPLLTTHTQLNNPSFTMAFHATGMVMSLSSPSDPLLQPVGVCASHHCPPCSNVTSAPTDWSWSCRTRTLPLPHMVHDVVGRWSPADPQSSPSATRLPLVMCMKILAICATPHSVLWHIL